MLLNDFLYSRRFFLPHRYFNLRNIAVGHLPVNISKRSFLAFVGLPCAGEKQWTRLWIVARRAPSSRKFRAGQNAPGHVPLTLNGRARRRVGIAKDAQAAGAAANRADLSRACSKEMAFSCP
jgi:hypothetical protein